MAISITHPFVSLKGDGGDATLVKPSHWNAAHATSMATGNLLGRLTLGAGAFEEIPISAYMASLLAATDVAALADMLGIFTTGDVKWSYDDTASSGWVVVNHATTFTIGNAASGASLASATAQALFVMLYTNVSNTYAPVSGGRTGNALNDFNAGKKLTIFLTGRSPIGAGTGASGITSRVVGETGGAETHTNTLAQLPIGITATGTISGVATPTGRNIPSTGGGINVQPSPSTGGNPVPYANDWAGMPAANLVVSGTASVTSNNTGGQAHNNIHPIITLYAHVKL